MQWERTKFFILRSSNRHDPVRPVFTACVTLGEGAAITEFVMETAMENMCFMFTFVHNRCFGPFVIPFEAAESLVPIAN
jgi:hypothetical protein